MLSLFSSDWFCFWLKQPFQNKNTLNFSVENKKYFKFYRNYKLMNTVQTPVCVVSENGIGMFIAKIPSE